MQPGCSCRAAEEPPKSTRLSWQSAQGGIKERLENPGNRFNMSLDKQFLTRWPKLGFWGFFSPSVLFHLPSAGIHRVLGQLWGDSIPTLPREGFWAEPRCDTLGQPHAVTWPLNSPLPFSRLPPSPNCPTSGSDSSSTLPKSAAFDSHKPATEQQKDSTERNKSSFQPPTPLATSSPVFKWKPWIHPSLWNARHSQ